MHAREYLENTENRALRSRTSFFSVLSAFVPAKVLREPISSMFKYSILPHVGLALSQPKANKLLNATHYGRLRRTFSNFVGVKTCNDNLTWLREAAKDLLSIKHAF